LVRTASRDVRSQLAAAAAGLVEEMIEDGRTKMEETEPGVKTEE
jgi:hypothetical protein